MISPAAGAAAAPPYPAFSRIAATATRLVPAPYCAETAIHRNRGVDPRHPKRRCHDLPLTVPNLRQHVAVFGLVVMAVKHDLGGLRGVEKSLRAEPYRELREIRVARYDQGPVH